MHVAVEFSWRQNPGPIQPTNKRRNTLLQLLAEDRAIEVSTATDATTEIEGKHGPLDLGSRPAGILVENATLVAALPAGKAVENILAASGQLREPRCVIEDDAGRVCQCVPSVGSWATVKYEDRLDSVTMRCQLCRVVQNLAEPEANLLSLVGSCQRLDLRDVHPAAMRPTEIELRAAAVSKVRFDTDRAQFTREPAHRLLVGCRATVERGEVDDKAGIPADSSPRPYVCVEGLGEDSVDRSRNDLNTRCTTTQPTATRWTAMKQVGEASSIDDMHVSTTGPALLGEHEFLAVLPRAVDHRTASEIPVYNESYRVGRPVSPFAPPVLHMTTALSLGDAFSID